MGRAPGCIWQACHCNIGAALPINSSMTPIISRELAPVAALVVGYMPDRPVLDRLLLSLLAEAEAVFLLDNGGSQAYLSDLPVERARVRYIDMGGNAGLGAALNRGMQEARAAGLRYVITFDQDSAPPDGMPQALLGAMQTQLQAGISCAAVAPLFYDRREKQIRCFPLYRERHGQIHVTPGEKAEPLHEVDVLITSGMLVDSDAWAEGLHYEEGLMVDYTDTDWCFRARAAGKRLFVCAQVRMPHALSDTPPVRVLGVHLLRYSPLRRYYYFRNTAYFVRRPYVSWAWRRRLLAGLPVRLVSNLVLDEQPFRSLRLSLTGFWHGLRGRLGPYPS